jgi:hypothetical protein
MLPVGQIGRNSELEICSLKALQFEEIDEKPLGRSVLAMLSVNFQTICTWRK